MAKKNSVKIKSAKAGAPKYPKNIAVKKTKTVSFKNLRQWNILLALLLVAQGIAISVLSKTITLPITTGFLNVNTLASQAAGYQVLAQANRHLFDVNVMMLVSAFIFLSAFFHFLAAAPYKSQYETMLKQGANKLRYIEFSLTAGLMFLLVGLLNGIYDFSILLAIFVLIVLFQLLGYFQENPPETSLKLKNKAFRGMLLAGGTVWLIIVIYLKAAIIYGHGLPHYIYFIDGSIFILSLGLALNAYLALKRIGKWRNYLYVERGYMILGLVAKTALAWQIFAGVLRT